MIFVIYSEDLRNRIIKIAKFGTTSFVNFTKNDKKAIFRLYYITNFVIHISFMCKNPIVHRIFATRIKNVTNLLSLESTVIQKLTHLIFHISK